MGISDQTGEKQSVNTITLAQEKGGVGKTTLTITLAAGLADRGHRVVILDADAQASATNALDVADQPGIYNLLIRGASFQDVLLNIDPQVWSASPSNVRGELYLVPSNIETRNISNMLNDLDAVMNKFRILENWADFVIIDTPPTPSLWHSSLYLASDYVIYPVLCEMGSLDSLAKTITRLTPLTQMRRGIGANATKILGIVPTMYRPQTSLHAANLDNLKQAYGELVKVGCPQRVAWAEAAQMRKSIFAYEPRNGAYQEAKSFVDTMLEGLQVNHD